METLPEESELWCFSEGTNIVHDMTELVEVSLNLVMVKQSWLVGCGLAEVCHHGTDWRLPLLASYSSPARLDREHWTVPRMSANSIFHLPLVKNHWFVEGISMTPQWGVYGYLSFLPPTPTLPSIEVPAYHKKQLTQTFKNTFYTDPWL